MNVQCMRAGMRASSMYVHLSGRQQAVGDTGSEVCASGACKQPNIIEVQSLHMQPCSIIRSFRCVYISKSVNQYGIYVLSQTTLRYPIGVQSHLAEPVWSMLRHTCSMLYVLRSLTTANSRAACIMTYDPQFQENM